MRYRSLGRTATSISAVGVGAMNLSGVYVAAEDRESEALLRDQLRRMAADRDVTLAQLTLAWILQQGDHIAAITGTRKLSRFGENTGAADIELDPETLQVVDRLFLPGSAAGARAGSGYLSRIDS